MAYAAVISLRRTIERLSKSYNPCPQNLQLVHEEVRSLQQVLRNLNWITTKTRCETLNDLDAQITGALFQFEHLLESDDHFNQSPISFSSDLHQDIDSFIHTSIKLKVAYDNELHNELVDEENDDVHVVPSTTTTAHHFNQSAMVGLSDQFTEIQDDLTANYSYKRLTLLFGMAGIGKTALAIKLFQDPFVSSCYDARAFVTVGQTDRLQRVLLDILRQVNPDIDDDDEEIITEEGERGVARMVNQSLQDRKYLIVLDDVWDKQMDRCKCFPDNGNGSHVLITSRLQLSSSYYQIRFLDKKESWNLLREKVFGEDQSSCPRELEKAGKKIAEYCEGLPLTIVTVAKHLAEAEKSAEYWNKIAEKKQNNPIFNDAYDQMLEVLYPSYTNLHQHLKACFLYMGVFPQSNEIPCAKLFNLWMVEEILEMDDNMYVYANQFFDDLVSHSLVMVRKRGCLGGTKTSGLHSSFWYLCKKEAGKIKFFHVLNSLDDSLAPDIESQRRLCVHNNVLFGIKDAYNSMDSVSTARSLLCTGPYHQYPVPICLCSSLLRVLDAVTIRLYEFPMEVLKLARLRYFSLTYDGKLPASISKLWNLRFFTVRRHLSIVESDGNLSYCPIDIWDMKELEHLQILGSDLPDPLEDSVLPNLLTLLDVSSHSCTKRVFERVPNLQKLGIRIELSPDATQQPSCCFNHISQLHKLKTLKCVVVNPRIVPVVSPPIPLSILSSSLEKLTLSGFGYPWKEMSKISSVLPNLRVLKLRCGVFRGPEWETGEEAFRRLEYLLIEDTDLVHWTLADHCSFQMLRCLSIKHCYKLKEIPLELGQSLRKIELVDCNIGALASANKVKEKRNELFSSLDISHAHSSLR